MFKDRKSAGTLLAKQVYDQFDLDKIDEQLIVTGIPCGGISVALEVAAILKSNLTILASKKIRDPKHKELALGAVTASGLTVIDENMRSVDQRFERYVANERNSVLLEAREIEKKWNCLGSIADIKVVKNRIVIVVDDGIASGMTALAAIRCLKTSGASKVILATPLISKSAFSFLKEEVQQIISLKKIGDFVEVDKFYTDSSPLERNVESIAAQNILSKSVSA